MTRAVSVVVGCVFVLSCGTQQLPHSGEEPAFPLRGKHTAVTCLGACHIDDFGPLPNSCVGCHEVDRPAPDHYPGEACDGCHVEDGWEIVTEPPEPTPTVPGFDHSTLAEDQLCWGACHEADRPEPTHYADPALPMERWWDCSGCHEPLAWAPAIVHPARIPHGSTASPGCEPVADDALWVTGCVGCHPDGTDTFVCYACHEGVHPGDNHPESRCLGCHVAGEPTDCASP